MNRKITQALRRLAQSTRLPSRTEDSPEMRRRIAALAARQATILLTEAMAESRSA